MNMLEADSIKNIENILSDKMASYMPDKYAIMYDAPAIAFRPRINSEQARQIESILANFYNYSDGYTINRLVDAFNQAVSGHFAVFAETLTLLRGDLSQSVALTRVIFSQIGLSELIDHKYVA